MEQETLEDFKKHIYDLVAKYADRRNVKWIVK